MRQPGCWTGSPTRAVTLAEVRDWGPEHRATIATTGLVPVIGPRTMSQLDTYLAALDVELNHE